MSNRLENVTSNNVGNRIVPAITLTKDPDREYLCQFHYWETVNIEKLTNLTQTVGILKRDDECSGEDWTNWFSNQTQQLQSIMKEYVPSEKAIKIVYQFSDNNRCQYGRVYPKGHRSLGELSGKLRSYVLIDMWTALDIANCHPTILDQVLSYHQIPHPCLELYCREREQVLKDCMEHFQVNRDQVKKLFIRLSYSGTFKAWAFDNQLGLNAKPTEFIKKFEEEIAKITSTIVELNKDLQSTLKPNENTIKKHEQKKKVGRPPKKQKTTTKEQEEAVILASDEQVMSYFCTEHERRILRHMFDFLVKQGIICLDHLECMLRYDGIDILKNAVPDDTTMESLLREMSEYVFAMTGFKLQIVEKPYHESPLKAEIDQQLAFEDQIPNEGKDELDTQILSNLKYYPSQKYYFEKYVAKIMFESNFAWVQRSQVKYINQAIKINKKDLVTSFEHIVGVTVDEKGNERTIRFIDQWVKDPTMRICNEVDFLPYNPDIDPNVSDGVFNLFRGFANPKNVQLQHPREVYLMAFHFIGLHLCEGDPLKYQFLYEYGAHSFQNSRKRLDLSFVFQDKPQGTGADVWFNALGALIGNIYYKNSSNISDFFGKHAEGIENKLLVVMNELEIGDSAEYQSRLKDLITCTRTTVNAKHLRPYEVSVYALIVFFSNRFNAIKFDNENNERRFVVWRPTKKCLHTFTPEDWDYLVHVLFKSKEFLAALYDEFMAVDLSNWQPKTRRILTMSKLYMQSSELNAPLHAKFFVKCLRDMAANTKPVQGTLETSWTSPAQP